MAREQTEKEILAIGRRMWRQGYVAANDGNISVRLADGSFLVTPSGVSKGRMRPGTLLRVDSNGGLLAGKGTVTSELGMHLMVYRQHPDVRAVMHAHPPYATTLAAAELPLDKEILPELVIFLGQVPLAPYATPSTPEVAASIQPFLADHDAILLSHHGVLTYGSTLEDAYAKLERVEACAQIYYNLLLLDRVRVLPPEAVDKLKSLRAGLKK